MKLLSFLLPGLLSIAAACAQSMPDSAQRALQQLELDLAAAKRKAAQQLEAAKQFEMRKGNLEGANLIQTKIAELTGGAAAPVSAAPIGAATAPTKPVTKQLPIQANAKFGAEIGPVRAGQTIKVEYVEGRWGMSGGASGDPKKWVSPDDNVFAGSLLGLYAVEDGEAKLLAEVPPGTKRRPFRHRFEKDCAQPILKIRDSDPVDNAGSTIYSVTIYPVGG